MKTRNYVLIIFGKEVMMTMTEMVIEIKKE